MHAEAARRLLSGTRSLYGLALLADPEAIAGVRDLGVPGRVFARLLGARQLIEAHESAGRHPLRRDVFALVDATHALSTLWLARRLPARARSLHRNAAIATAFAVLGWVVRVTSQPRSTGGARGEDRVA